MGQILESADPKQVLSGPAAFTVEPYGGVEHVRVGLNGPQTRYHRDGRTSPHRCDKNYVTTDPRDLSRRLEAAGFTVTKCGFNRTGNVSLLEARYPGAEAGDYVDAVGMALDHRGRRPILLQPTALRVLCLNQFRAPALEFHHCGPEAREFVLDPAKFAFDARYLARQARERIESLRGVRGGAGLLLHLETAAPRLFKRAFGAAVNYCADGTEFHNDSGATMWAALQAMTDTKSPTLVNMVCSALSDGYEDLQAGRVPACWTAD